ncbi:MAG TPA: molecular chaperone DnaK, partial [Lachnospiraceae bacterium]|nr:molecular chaperone DnaK [Lachnospiraceae bacterium]
GIATKIVERNSTIPARYTQIFSTAMPYQTTVEIKVLQGERQFARDNTLLGTFRLTGIRRAMAGVPQIEVTFDIDANGILNVSAKDLGTGRQNSIVIVSGSKMSDDEIKRAMDDAAFYADDDNARKKRFDAINNAKRKIAQAQLYIQEHKQDLDKEKKRGLKSASAAVEKSIRWKKADKLTEGELDEIIRKTQELDALLGDAAGTDDRI